MDTRIIEVIRAKNGRLYPADLPRTQAEHQRLARLAHALVHRDGLSIRQAMATLLDSYGIRRSRGAIARDLHIFECEQCRDLPVPAPAQRQPGRAQQHHGSPGAGYLTAGLADDD